VSIGWPVLALVLLTAGMCLWAYWPHPELCRLAHPHSALRRSWTGLPGWICEECGAVYHDLHDAGRIPVIPGEFNLERWMRFRLPVWQARTQHATFVPSEFKVIRRSAGGVHGS